MPAPAPPEKGAGALALRVTRPDLADPALACRWRALAARVGASFFKDWTWVGCLAAERFTRPVLVEAQRDGQDVGLALFNRRADRPWGHSLWLHEAGDPAWDGVFTEHNGPLAVDAAAAAAVLREALGGRARRIVLSGLDPADAGLARGLARAATAAERDAPFVDLARLGHSPFVQALSRNTRAQVRRSDRAYAAAGPLTLVRAGTPDEARATFAELVCLHDATWRARGEPGAFATAARRRFYAALLDTGVPRGEVDLLRIAAGDRLVGCLMNFRGAGVASAYQSGFDYRAADPHEKPGLTCHVLAVEAARAAGLRRYDFLAGKDRYKTSLANDSQTLSWLALHGAAHPARLTEAARRAAARLRPLSQCILNRFRL